MSKSESKSEKILVAPSLLSADPLHFGRDAAAVEAAGADWHHVDVMDGHFVPNLTFGLSFIKAMKAQSKIPLDVHIMVSNPDTVAEQYLDAGADILVFHVEAAMHAHRIIQLIHARGRKAGIALNPGTPLEEAFALAPYVDVIMMMSVNPGFGGQSFIPETVDRIARLHTYLKSQGLEHKVLIEVDGGINPQTATQVIAAGARVLVAGTAVYGSPDRKAAIAALRCL